MRKWIVGAALLASLAGVGIYARYGPPGRNSSAAVFVPPPIRVEKDAQGASIASCDHELLQKFFADCELRTLSKPLPPIEKEQFETFHAALVALGKERSAENVGFVGMFFFNWEFFPMADALLLKAHELAPREHRWCHYLGYNAAAMGDSEKAERYYKEAIRLDPNYFASYLQLARLYLQLDRVDESEQLLLKSIEVEPIYLKAKELKSPQPYAHGELGAIALQRNDLARAEKYCLQALERDPRDPRAHALLGQVYARLGNAEKERFHTSAGATGSTYSDPVPDPLALELRQKTNALALVTQRAKLEHELKQYARLVQSAEEIARRDPLPERFMQLADAYRLNGQFDKAREVALDALRQHPERAMLHLTLAKIEFSAGNLEDAVPIFDDAIARDPELMEAYQWKAKALASKGLDLADQGEPAQALPVLNEAQAVIRKSLELSPTDACSASVLAKITFQIGRVELSSGGTPEDYKRVRARYEEAHRVLSNALSKQPCSGEIAQLLKELTGQMQQLDAFLKKQGITISPTDPE